MFQDCKNLVSIVHIKDQHVARGELFRQKQMSGWQRPDGHGGLRAVLIILKMCLVIVVSLKIK